MDAYQTGVIAIENAAVKICRGDIELGNASPATYIANAGKPAPNRFPTANHPSPNPTLNPRSTHHQL